MLPLADAARCRSEADWLVGINGTRAMTAFNSRDGGFFLTTVGRVQTPTLSIMVEREEKIRKHVSRDYWEVRATFAVRPASTRASGSTRRGRRTPTTTSCAPTGSGTRPTRWRSPPRCRASRRRSARRPSRAPGAAAALRPDQPAARGQLALRLLGPDDALDRPGAVREAQGADLPADRQPRSCPEDYVAVVKRHDRDDREGGPARPAARARRARARRRSRKATSSRSSGSSTTPRSRTTSRSSRRCWRRRACPRSRPSSTTWSSSASSRSSSRRPSSW